MTIRAIVVDDEEPARELLRAFLRAWPDVEIVGEAADGNAAVDLIREQRPDIVFLDVQMPSMNGFEVVAALDSTGVIPSEARNRLPPEAAPLIVFVTAYDQYALRAFEVSACDYLLKPFDADRLAATMRRVFARRDGLGDEVRRLLGHLRQSKPQQIVVKSDGRHVFLDLDEIEWVEAVGKDLRLHLGGRVLMVREAMNSIEHRLDPARFLRVHRSAIVNRGRIREMQPWFKGDYLLILRSGARVVSGRTYRDAVHALLSHTG